jgi:hypothetical protein
MLELVHVLQVCWWQMELSWRHWRAYLPRIRRWTSLSWTLQIVRRTKKRRLPRMLMLMLMHLVSRMSRVTKMAWCRWHLMIGVARRRHRMP